MQFVRGPGGIRLGVFRLWCCIWTESVGINGFVFELNIDCDKGSGGKPAVESRNRVQIVTERVGNQ